MSVIKWKKFYNDNMKSIKLKRIDWNREEKKINILIRHTYRPEGLKKCIESITNQNYNNYNIILCYDDKRSEEYLKKSLSNRFEISESRFTNIRFDITKRKIFITVDSRLANTNELSVGEILVSIRKTLINDPIKIFNKKHNHYISKLTYMDVLKSDSNTILIDNTMYKGKMNE